MKMRFISLALATSVVLGGCVSKEAAESRNAKIRQLWQVMGVKDDSFGLNPQVKKICHAKFQKNFISKAKFPDSWKMVKELAPMEFATAVYMDSAPRAKTLEAKESQLNSVFFMSEYEGTNWMNLPSSERYICQVQLKNNSLIVPYVAEGEQFQNTTGLPDSAPSAWFN